MEWNLETLRKPRPTLTSKYGQAISASFPFIAPFTTPSAATHFRFPTLTRLARTPWMSSTTATFIHTPTQPVWSAATQFTFPRLTRLGPTPWMSSTTSIHPYVNSFIHPPLLSLPLPPSVPLAAKQTLRVASPSPEFRGRRHHRASSSPSPAQLHDDNDSIHTHSYFKHFHIIWTRRRRSSELTESLWSGFGGVRSEQQRWRNLS